MARALGTHIHSQERALTLDVRFLEVDENRARALRTGPVRFVLLAEVVVFELRVTAVGEDYI